MGATLIRPGGDSSVTLPQYVTLAATATLANERILTGTTNQIVVTDNGAGSTVVLSTPQNLHTSANPQFATIELGAAADTTLARSSAGVVTIEGVEITTNTGTQTLTNKTLGATSLSGAISLPSSVSSTSSTHWLGKDSNGPIFNVGAAGSGGALQVMSNGALNINLNETYGVVFYTNQTITSASSAAQICRTSGHFNINAQNGADVQIQSGGSNLAIFGASQAYIGATTFTGLVTCQADIAHTASGSLNGIYKNVDTGVFAITGGSGWAYGNGAWDARYGNSHATKPGIYEVHSGSAAGAAIKFYDRTNVVCAEFSEKSASLKANGVTFTDDGNWYDLYDLAAGTHNGEFKIYSALFSGAARLTIGGTSISLTSDEWGFADVTAASGKIAFRVSGGKLQINVGTSISSTPKNFWAKYEGCVN